MTSIPESGTIPLSRRIALAAGPLVFLWCVALPPGSLDRPAGTVLGLAIWMAVWWVSEAVPLAATSLLPIATLPLVGVRTIRQAAEPFANEIIFLFLAGFLLAAALERWRCHERIAYGIVGQVGGSPRRIVLGVMMATAFISMWISNTATTAMMFPIVLAIGGLFADGKTGERARIALLLGMAYAATIGGMGTLIGTPPNLILAGATRELIGETIDFGRFMLVGFPIVLVLLPAAWALLVFGLFPLGAESGAGAGEAVAQRERALGRIRGGERTVFIVFGLTALAWFFREPKDLGSLTIPGLTGLAPQLSDAGVGLIAVLVLFTGRGRASDGLSKPLLTWREAHQIPWDVLLLFGGGLSLAAAMDSSGLTGWIAGGLEGLRGYPLPVIFLGLAALIVALGEFASNTAMAAVMMPLVASLASALGQPPLLLMLVAGLSASLGFALPVATPPNAIVFGSGMIPMRQMVRAGLALDLISILILVAILSVMAPLVFGGS